MFDDTPVKNTGGAPANLPVGEPEDIFSTQRDAPSAASSEQPLPPVRPPSALSSGALKPKETVRREEQERKDGARPIGAPRETATESASPQFLTPPPVGPGRESMKLEEPKNPDMYHIREPKVSRRLIVVVLGAVLLAALGAGGWWVYRTWTNRGADGIPAGTGAPVRDGSAPENGPATSTPQPDNGAPDDAVLFGETTPPPMTQPVDADADGLDDLTEKDLGTDPANWDTDQDELNDYEEVMVWKTDPFGPDTDGDGFIDGLEVKRGYSPSGPGKIFEPSSVNGTTTAK